MKIDENIRQGVIKSLPEANQIKNEELREKVYDAGAHSLEGGFVQKSLAAEIVYYADHAFWGLLAKADIVGTMKTFSYRVLRTIP